MAVQVLERIDFVALAELIGGSLKPGLPAEICLRLALTAGVNSTVIVPASASAGGLQCPATARRLLRASAAPTTTASARWLECYRALVASTKTANLAATCARRLGSTRTRRLQCWAISTSSRRSRTTCRRRQRASHPRRCGAAARSWGRRAASARRLGNRFQSAGRVIAVKSGASSNPIGNQVGFILSHLGAIAFGHGPIQDHGQKFAAVLISGFDIVHQGVIAGH